MNSFYKILTFGRIKKEKSEKEKKQETNENEDLKKALKKIIEKYDKNKTNSNL